MKRFFFSLTVIAGLLVAIPPSPTATAIDYIRLTGVIQSNWADRNAPTTIQIRLQGQSGGQILDGSINYGSGNYSMLVPKNTPVEITVTNGSSISFLQTYNSHTSSTWRKSTTFNQDSILNFNIPPGIIKVSGRVVDAQGNPLRNALVRMGSGSMDDFQISSDGTLWRGINQSQVMKSDAAGNFALYSYPTRSKENLTVREDFTEKDWISPSFVLDGPIEFIVCFPINFGASLSLPTFCTQDQFGNAVADKAAAEAKAAAAAVELKARQEAAAKAAIEKFEAEMKARQEAAAKAAATKKTVIVCVKGKLTKKVTAVKPKCPAGYKVKK